MGDKAFFEHFGPFMSGLTAMSGAQLYHYAAGTTTDKDAWADNAKAATVSQPLNADAYGVMDFYGDGSYRFVIVDPNSTTLYDWDNVQVGPVQPSEISVHKNGTDQSALSAAAWTKLTWSTEEFDATGTFATNKWTPARVGRALVEANVLFNSVASATSFAIAIYKNSSLLKMQAGLAGSTVSGAYGVGIVTIVDIVSTTDFVEIYADPGSADSDVEGDSDKTWFTGSMIA